MSDDRLRQFGCGTLDQASCPTCADLAVPVRVLTADGDTATVEDASGARAPVNIELVTDAQPGDVLLVHAGVAIRRLETA